jgi:hypothetical protein
MAIYLSGVHVEHEYAIIFKFSNDRYHDLGLRRGSSVEDVVSGLRNFASRLESDPNLQEGRLVAPWDDFAGGIIHEGDVIVHPSGECGRVVIDKHEDRDRWKVDYGDGLLSSLALQIGDKGQAVVDKANHKNDDKKLLEKPVCDGCGADDYEGELLTCPYCESPKCSHCDDGNDVPCLICE